MKNYKINPENFESVTSIPVKIVKSFSDKLTEDERKELYEAIQYYKIELEKDFVKQLDESIVRFKTFLK